MCGAYCHGPYSTNIQYLGGNLPGGCGVSTENPISSVLESRCRVSFLPADPAASNARLGFGPNASSELLRSVLAFQSGLNSLVISSPQI